MLHVNIKKYVKIHLSLSADLQKQLDLDVSICK